MQYRVCWPFCFCWTTTLLLAGTLSMAQSPDDGRKSPNERVAQQKPIVAVTISKETTDITGPLRKDSYVDYVAALNERWSKGVTPENNAAVLFWKAMGPADIPKADRPQFFKMLGIPPLPEEGEHFLQYDKYVERLQNLGRPTPPQLDEFGLDENQHQYYEAMKRPWSKKELPMVFGWLVANEKPMALLSEAAMRPRRYDPIVVGEKESMDRAMALSLSAEHDVVRAFLARAMLRVGEGQIERGWEDLLTCHRLSRQHAHCPTIPGTLVALTLDNIACAGDLNFARYVSLTRAHAARLQADIDKLSALPKVFEAMNTAERWGLLHCVSAAARGNVKPIINDVLTPTSVAETAFATFTLGRVDFDVVLRTSNSLYDRIVAALQTSNARERISLLRCIDEEIKRANHSQMDVKSLFGLSRQAISKRFGTMLVAEYGAANLGAVYGAYGAETQLSFVRLAFALAGYRANHGSYPEKLADIVPKYIAAVPKDAFIDADLHYRRECDGYLLYSVGVNGKDDDGKSYDDRTDDEDWDDVTIRLPAIQDKKQ